MVAERPAQDTEILFIEQGWQYLREGGYLAIVVPDGILTNSSLQYVRSEIEDIFRIVAVISLPQTAFVATGAGVKSSVLFLRKHAAKETKRICDTKQGPCQKRGDANLER
jgi:type I restriction enzyme M protein